MNGRRLQREEGVRRRKREGCGEVMEGVAEMDEVRKVVGVRDGEETEK